MATENSGNQQFNDELRGALFRNDKGGVDSRPDYRGRVTVNGVLYRLSGWKKTAKQSGQPFISLALTRAPDDQQPAPATSDAQQGTEEDWGGF